jgi:hypothetical protein
MSDWKRLRVPPFCERLYALTIPDDNQLIVLSYEGAHQVNLTEPIWVEDCDAPEDAFDERLQVLSYRGKQLPTIGLYGNQAAVTAFGPEKIVVDAESEVMTVLPDDRVPYSFKYENFSGDWVAATFSRDGQHIVLACPYDFDFVVLKRQT